ncbi:hypothetical protein DPEC_G00330400 [Dallia pectoralis]|uniref:Uncharacterized protein n=1 Tax=Dallia pectoralis TaxID=75939 RepID=A0ACC2F967_DALPE|nr:hypothetical protein DPEC_G00330400 [Dallia pectoralis]
MCSVLATLPLICLSMTPAWESIHPRARLLCQGFYQLQCCRLASCRFQHESKGNLTPKSIDVDVMDETGGDACVTAIAVNGAERVNTETREHRGRAVT